MVVLVVATAVVLLAANLDVRRPAAGIIASVLMVNITSVQYLRLIIELTTSLFIIRP